jgi:hypothetical protein
MTRHTATVARTYTHPGAVLVANSQGNMQDLANGDEVVGWGAKPYVSEFAPGGTLLFDAHMPLEMSSYRAFRFPWSGHPLTEPAVSATVLPSGDTTAVYASWNGATDVSSWRVLAGPDPGSLTAQATMPDTGFESSVSYPDNYEKNKVEYLAVQALDAGGHLLATSPTVKVAPPPPSPPA